jgi:hypothetical protein
VLSRLAVRRTLFGWGPKGRWHRRRTSSDARPAPKRRYGIGHCPRLLRGALGGPTGTRETYAVVKPLTESAADEFHWPPARGCKTDAPCARNAESPANAGLFGERLKGFEPSTFCMASRRWVCHGPAKCLHTNDFRQARRRAGVPRIVRRYPGLDKERTMSDP